MSPRRLLAVLVPLALAVTFVSTSAGTAQSQVPTQSPINVTIGSIRVDPSQPRLNISYGHSDLEL